MYIIKILVLRQMQKNQIFIILSALFIIGMPIWSMAQYFKDKNIRVVWNDDEENWYFSVVDVVGILTDNDYQKSRNYWKWLKKKLIQEGSGLVSNTNQLKMKELMKL